MAEYVCRITDDYPGVPFDSDDYSGTLERRERIVRCRDCEHATGCRDTEMLDCAHFAQWDYYGDEPGRWLVQPDGFCAWGEERQRCR